ncbi:S8 family peptidase [Parvularcula flava]|uniref:S8 family peptidase n=1 Tax=Aquisalinus luteolus TaxID=1566827 RepID=A0ABX0HGB8_9PROT|nr:S8 family peptidase [Aquisalinus luteolus]NHK27155.1 S8 family peptidase [Aquisalinus luteolus]
MTDRPLLRWTEVSRGQRTPSGRRNIPKKPKSTPGYTRQGQRLASRIDPLVRALDGDQPAIELKADPRSIAPERALVFETSASIQNFARAARTIGLEIYAEEEGEAIAAPDGFEPAEGEDKISPVLYATMPSMPVLERFRQLWRQYQRGQNEPEGLKPWWDMFEMLIDLRPWGPEDRLPTDIRGAIEDRIPFNDDDDAFLELEVWPSANDHQRRQWREEVEATTAVMGGRVLDRSSIRLEGFIYEAVLVAVPAGELRRLIADPYLAGGLASVDGLQFILPQTIAQTEPISNELLQEEEELAEGEAFDEDAPLRAVLLDGVPVAAHPDLDGGVVVEDVHDIERVSPVAERRHGTAMASLILRGDLKADGVPVRDSRILSVPVLIDGPNGSRSPQDRLFVDIIHTALAECFLGDEPLSPDAFVVNLSLGVSEQRFGGRISALARLLDWWSYHHGVLFVVSAGNISDDLILRNQTAMVLEDADVETHDEAIRRALAEAAFGRTLLSPSEALNVLTVGATSTDLAPEPFVEQDGLRRYGSDEVIRPQVSSAIGLGPAKALKPDLLMPGGIQELRVLPAGNDCRVRSSETQRTGLVAASIGPLEISPRTRSRGTSPAAALTTRAILQAAAALTEDEGPFPGLELPRIDLALATRALAVNGAIWPNGWDTFEEDAKQRLGKDRTSTPVKDQVAKVFGYGVLEPVRMADGPANGATLIGFGTIRKDQSRQFELSLPPSLSGQKLPRMLRVTLAWFSPAAPTRALYRCAALEAACINEDGEEPKEWFVRLKGVGPDENMMKRGTVWSKRLEKSIHTTPAYGADAFIPIRVQCREVGSGGLSPDDDIRFAIAASFEVEGDIRFDVYEEIKEAIRLRVARRG